MEKGNNLNFENLFPANQGVNLGVEIFPCRRARGGADDTHDCAPPPKLS